MMAILQELQRLGKTIIISSHILSELQTLCNRCAIIEKGRLIYSGPVQGVRNEAHPGRVFHVKVGGVLHTAVEILQARPEIREAVEEDGRIKVMLSDDRVDASMIPEVLVKAGVRLLEFREDEMGLEEVFLKVTRGETQ